MSAADPQIPRYEVAAGTGREAKAWPEGLASADPRTEESWAGKRAARQAGQVAAARRIWDLVVFVTIDCSTRRRWRIGR